MRELNKDFVVDIIVVGSGVAGLYFAINMADFGQVLVITKKERTESNTNYAQGGIAAVLSSNDSFESHINDTMICGDGLCNKRVVEKVVRKAPDCISNLVEMGARFNRKEDGSFDLGIEGGHSKRRIVHANDLTGREIEHVLLKTCLEHPSITILENRVAINLFVKNNRCLGCYVLNKKTGEIQNFVSKLTVLATGGIGKVFLHSTNPDVATGDGIAMAYRAGATIMDMEFTQFHPTTLYHPLADSFLISESLRGEGAILTDSKRSRFMMDYHPMMELAPRDIVAQAIDNELKKSGESHVLLDISMKNPKFIRNRFPEIYDKCLSYNIDITQEAIPVVPAAHYCCGGIKATIKGITNVRNLLAIGEVSCTALHGANRLASNSIIEALVCGFYASQECKRILERGIPIKPFPIWEAGEAVNSDEMIVVTHNLDEIRRLMWNYVGIMRSNKRLLRARDRIELLIKEIDQYYWDFIINADLVEIRNLALIAKIIIYSAMLRKETRGIHYSLDYPRKNVIAKHTILNRNLLETI